MTVHDDDILDFDFVDDETRELPPASRPGGPRPPGGGGEDPPRQGGGGPRRPQFRAPHGITPLLRLAGLVALAILVVVLLAVWVQGCAAEDEQTTYSAYLGDVGEVGRDSAKIGADLATLLTTPGLAQTELETKLGGFVQRQQLDVERARDLDPPGPLTPAQLYAVQALEMRLTGLQGMLETFRATKDTDDQTAAGQLLAANGQRLEASDVVWKDLFQGTATTTMASEGVEGLNAPASVFVENPELYTARSMSSIWQRVHGASTGGTPSGSHGSALAYTEVQPAGVQLSTTTETKITISTDLAFEVGATNSGENQEVGVKVKLTIPAQPSIVKTGTIDVIDPGETKTVTFSDFPDFPFGENTTVQVTVEPVPGETNTGNNTAEYPVVFTLEPS
ncbi:MAG TPA: CARDB domain-containing protein [Gaiella sp.]|nr:CARDB domain-containing protein [Gaiella sp.]